MSQIDKALDRLTEAVNGLIDRSQDAEDAAIGAEEQIADLTAERDRLRSEIAKLRTQHEEDARLRAEAAEAVKDALKDLRGLVAAE
jgi:chromosome segregation ATPase